MRNSEPSRSELLHRIAELEARLAGYETGQTESAFAREITGRKQAEQAWRESEERLRLFMESIPASIAMFDRDMRYMAVSRRWSVEYLRGAEYLLGQSHYEVFPECPERWRAAHRRGLAGEKCRGRGGYVASRRWLRTMEEMGSTAMAVSRSKRDHHRGGRF